MEMFLFMVACINALLSMLGLRVYNFKLYFGGKFKRSLQVEVLFPLGLQVFPQGSVEWARFWDLIGAVVWGRDPELPGRFFIQLSLGLFCFVLVCSGFVLFWFVLFSSTLFFSVLFYSGLFCSALFRSVLFWSVLFCSVLFCSVLICSFLLFAAFHGLGFRV